MKKKLLVTLILISSVLLFGCKKDGKKNIKPKTDEEVTEELASLNDYGLDLFLKGDTLPSLNPLILSEQQSSYSRNGNNADGFGLPENVSGEVDEIDIDRPLLVLNQPGVIYRMWFTTWAYVPELRIYIDDDPDKTIKMNLSEIVSGQVEPFLKPLVFSPDEASGGFVSYTPIVFKKSIRISGSGSFYFNINYQKYPHGTNLEYDDFSNIDKVQEIFDNAGSDPKIVNNDKYTEESLELNPYETITLYESNRKETVTSLNLKINEFDVYKYDRTIHDKKGITISNGSTIEFDLDGKKDKKLDLVFEGYLDSVEQKGSLDVNGVKKPLKFRARRLDGFEWKEAPYFKDQIVEVSKAEKLKIKITGQTNKLTLYKVSVKSDGKVIDFIDFGSKKSKDLHNYNERGNIFLENHFYEYDPNDLYKTEEKVKQKLDERLANNLFIKITYPDREKEAVMAPLPSFFGVGAYGLFESLGLMVGLREDKVFYSYYPMPFEEGIKIELINKNDFKFTLDSKIGTETNLFENGTYGYFMTEYTKHVGNDPNSKLDHGEPITFLNTKGAGKVVGITHSVDGAYFGEHSRFYLEGDEQIYVDGSMSHSFHGTGTEDFYNGAWYFKGGTTNIPIFGQSVHNQTSSRDRTVMIRTMISDPIYFRSEIDFKMEHGGNNDRSEINVDAVVYYYLREEAQIEKVVTMSLNNEEATTLLNYEIGPKSSYDETTNGYYEGYYLSKRTKYTKTALIKDYSTFTIYMDPSNKGVLLRKEGQMKPLEQAANVYVDGVLVGIWQSAFRNAHGTFVRQDEFLIPESFTKNKNEVQIKIELLDSSELWTESMYEIFIIK